MVRTPRIVVSCAHAQGISGSPAMHRHAPIVKQEAGWEGENRFGGMSDPFSPTSTASSSSQATRRTRSSLKRVEIEAEQEISVKVEPVEPTVKLDLSAYAYQPVEPVRPYKRARATTPLVEVKTELVVTPSKASKLPLAALAKPHPEPARWKQQYALIERMRKGIQAPVDTMGCERPRTEGDPKTLRFHILISLMLSSQTKDAVTSQAVTNLHQTLPGGLTAETLASAPSEAVAECINKVGFWRRKTDYIQAAAKHLLEQPGDERGDVPKTLEGLCALKGVGPKMAFLALQCAWDINAGIGVDVHVHRITNRLGWHKPKTQTPEQTRLNLESWLPLELRKPINPVLVGFGQVICLPVGPRCDLCLLGKTQQCPSRVKVDPTNRKAVEHTFED